MLLSLYCFWFCCRPQPEPEPEPRKAESPEAAPKEEATTPAEAKKAEESVVQAEGMIIRTWCAMGWLLDIFMSVATDMMVFCVRILHMTGFFLHS